MQSTNAERLSYGIDEAAGLLGLSRRTVYHLLEPQGDTPAALKAVKIGTRRLILRTELERYLRRLQEAA